jgi:very-short-patch-repair endonuclease
MNAHLFVVGEESMKLQLLGLILVLLVFCALAILLKKRRTVPGGPWPLDVCRTVLSQPEQILYRRLVHALPNNLVFAQVQLSRFLEVKRGVPRQAWFNRISQLSADFLILNPDTSVVAAIELDDASHLRASRQAADARKTRALQSAGVRLIRWHVGSLPDEASIRVTFAGAANAKEI